MTRPDVAAPAQLDVSAAAAAATVLRSREPVNRWTVEDVCTFVGGLSMPDGVIKSFRENAVDGDMLLGLSDSDIQEELGMLKLQVRKLRRELDRLV